MENSRDGENYSTTLGHTPPEYMRNGTPGGIKYYGELEEHCYWGKEVKLYEHHVDALFAMFWRNKPDIKYYVCTINKTFARPSQMMNFQVHYGKENLKDYNHSDDDMLKIKLANSKVPGDCHIMLGMDKRATITANWSKCHDYANIRQGDICVFCSKVTANRCL